jgi:hypothetical protein
MSIDIDKEHELDLAQPSKGGRTILIRIEPDSYDAENLAAIEASEIA